MFILVFILIFYHFKIVIDYLKWIFINKSYGLWGDYDNYLKLYSLKMPMYDIIIGRNEADKKKYGNRGLVLLGKHYVKMGRTTSLSNPVYLDVASSHVVFICGKRGGGKCLHGDTLITLHDGTQKKISELAKNDKDVLSLNQDLKIETSQKSDFFSRKVNRLLKIKLRSGKEIKLTPEHPLLTIEGWKPAEDLKLNSRIATPRKLEAFGEGHLSESEVKIIAYLVTEGHLGNKKVLFTNKDRDIITDFSNAIKNFDDTLILRDHDEITLSVISGKMISDFEVLRDNKGRFTGSKHKGPRSNFQRWLKEMEVYGLKSKEKILPEPIFRLTKERTSLLINRMFSCDGSIHKDKTKGWIVSYASSSKKLIKQVHHLLLKFGILSKIREKYVLYDGKKHKSYEIIIQKQHTNKFLQEIGFFGKKEEKVKKALLEVPKAHNPNLDTVPRKIWGQYVPENWAEVGRGMGYKYPKSLRESIRYSPSRHKLAQIALLDNREDIMLLANSDIFWDEIVEIDELKGNFTVYDISVPENHNFVANDIIVHNSYTMGVVAEGFHLLEDEIKQNLSIILLDTMGIYWTMKYPNKADEDLLSQWGLKPSAVPITIYTPATYHEEFKKKGIPTDYPFSLDASELDQDDWCLAFKQDKYSPIGVIITKAIMILKEAGKKYNIDDIINTIKKDDEADKEDKEAAQSMFLVAKGWGIFSDKGTPLSDLAKGGQITVLDVSCYATMPGGWDIKSLIVGIVSQHLFIQRMNARKGEEYDSVDAAMNLFSSEAPEKNEMPLVWLVIDEAHEFLPRDKTVASSNPLITIMREGRQPGISLILATQQPGKIHTDVMTQSDTVISHRITAKIDTDALGVLMQSYMREGLVVQLDNLPRVKGAAIIFDDTNEKMYPMRVRPRISWHGGSAPVAVKEKKEFEF